MIIIKQINKTINGITHRYDPYDEYSRKIEKISNSNLVNQGNIIIAIIGGAYGHLFEGLYARKAKLNGVTPYILRCGNYLNYCDANPIELKHRRIRCLQCQAQQADFLNAFNGVDCQYKDYISKDEEKEIDEAINKYFTGELKSYKGVEIDKILFSALQRFYLIAEPKVKNDDVTRGFLHTILATLTVMENLCEKVHPRYVMSSHGTYSTWGAVVEYCKTHKIYVITYGQNYNHCGLEFTYDDSYLTGDLNDTENRWADHVLSEKERARVIRFFDERLGRVSDDKVAFDYNKNNKKHFNKHQICEMLGIDPTHKIVGVFPNIPWDGQVTGGSTVFPRYREWLRYTVDFFKERDDVDLVLRSHPAEVNIGTDAGKESTASIINDLYDSIPKNIHVLDPRHKINSYTLGDNSDFGITYSSTVSLELTYLGVPIILCGCPPFKDKDVAFDIDSVENYRALLERAINGELVVTEERKERLFKYLHYFFFMRTMPQTLLDIKDTIPKGYFFSSEKEMNSDLVFDEMYKKITAKEPMDFSRFYD